MPSDNGDVYVPAYDRLGGHIIATALLASHGQAGFDAWIREASTTAHCWWATTSDDIRSADDIVYSLVGQSSSAFLLEAAVADGRGTDFVLKRSEPLRGWRGCLSRCKATVDALLDLVRGGDAEDP
jgi:hypothetical protein